jgi:hypothetical protein
MKEKIQAILFSKNDFSRAQAMRWLERHNIPYLKIHTTAQYHRARIFTPRYGRTYSYRTITLSDQPYIRAVIQLHQT